jgi:2-methylcitrate dehydratase PrpD
LYPSCAATHPPLDAILELRRRERFQADDVESVEVGVDAITPTVLLYDRPTSGLEAKFSLPFCAAAAVVDGCVGLSTFEAAHLRDPRVAAMQARVRMSVDPSLDPGPALTQARVTVRLKDGRISARIPAVRAATRIVRRRRGTGGEVPVVRAAGVAGAGSRWALHVLREIETGSDVRNVTGQLQPSQRRLPWR